MSATNDGAVDGYYLEGLDEEGQARWVGYRAAAYRVATILVLGQLVIAADAFGWFWAFAIAAGVMGLLTLFHYRALPDVETPRLPIRGLVKIVLRPRLLTGAAVLAAIIVLWRTTGFQLDFGLGQVTSRIPVIRNLPVGGWIGLFTVFPWIHALMWAYHDSLTVDIRKLPTLARRATGTTEIFVDDARVPAANLLGAEGQGWQIITDHLELERIAVSAAYVGNAQTAVDDALTYAQQRVQFDRPIFDFQVIRHMLADMQTQVDAARLLVYRAAELAARQQACAKEVAMAKLFSSETLQSVSRMGMQILGGHSMLPEADMERYFREGMQCTIGGGTSQIQRSIISKAMRRAAS